MTEIVIIIVTNALPLPPTHTHIHTPHYKEKRVDQPWKRDVNTGLRYKNKGIPGRK